MNSSLSVWGVFTSDNLYQKHNLPGEMTFKAPAGSNWDEWENQFNWVVFPSYDEDLAKSQELSISSAKKSKHKDLESDMNSLLRKSPTD